MMIREDLIGVKIYSKKAGRNILIENDPTKFEYYRSLGLDVFKLERKTFPKQEKRAKGNNKRTSKHSTVHSKRKNNSK